MNHELAMFPYLKELLDQIEGAPQRTWIPERIPLETLQSWDATCCRMKGSKMFSEKHPPGAFDSDMDLFANTYGEDISELITFYQVSELDEEMNLLFDGGWEEDVRGDDEADQNT